MPTLNQIRTRVDDWLQARWPTLRDRQEAYFAQHGRYWQGLRTHLGNVEHSTTTTSDAIADNLGSAPSDQQATWMDRYPELAGYPFRPS
jgi:hypothetical protein